MGKNIEFQIFQAKIEEYVDKINKEKDFEDYLREKKKDELLDMLKLYGYATKRTRYFKIIYASIHKMKKEEIIKELVRVIDDVRYEIIRKLDEEQLDDLIHIAENEGEVIEKVNERYLYFKDIDILRKLGFIYCKKEKNELKIHMPKKIQEIFKEIYDIDNKYYEIYQEIVDYTNGIVKKFGLISIDGAYEVIKLDMLVTYNEFINIILFYEMLGITKFKYDDEINCIYENNLDEEDIKELFEREELYNDFTKKSYIELGTNEFLYNMREYKELKEYLKEEFDLDLNDNYYVREKIIEIYIAKSQIDENKGKEILRENVNEIFEINYMDKVKIMDMVEKIKDKMPVWKEGGQIIERAKIPKVGRNELCPCGSGKKYKHCHGKNE